MLTSEQFDKIERSCERGVSLGADCITLDINYADALVKMARRSRNEEAEFEIRQEGMTVAATFGPREKALEEARHYAAVYGQDGPTEIVEIIKIAGERG
jgi:hypothetical protein